MLSCQKLREADERGREADERGREADDSLHDGSQLIETLALQNSLIVYCSDVQGASRRGRGWGV